MENMIEEPVPKYSYISAEEYLETERNALEKHEYYQGEIFSMSGASLKHNNIFSNFFGDIAHKLKGKNCKPYGSDLRIHIPENTLYTYPDISIICGEVSLTDEHFDTATNPAVIIEILSKSTQGYGRINKFKLYRDIKSLHTYILVDSLSLFVELHTKNESGIWQLQDFKLPGDILVIKALQLEIALKDIYEGITFG
jgi:Uma2 family endonuclease